MAEVAFRSGLVELTPTFLLSGTFMIELACNYGFASESKSACKYSDFL